MHKIFKVLALPLLASSLLFSSPLNVYAAENVQVNMGVTGGSLTLSVPSAATPLVLPSVLISDVINSNQSPSTTFHNFNITDARGSGAGWNLHITTQAFTDGTNTLESDRTYVNGSALASQTGIWNNVPSKATLSDGSPYTLLSANVDNGMGSYDYSGLVIGYDFLVSDSTSLKAGSYTSQTTIAAVTGP